MNMTRISARRAVSVVGRLQNVVTLMALTLAGSVHAHPGHALTDAGAAHMLTDPDHLAVLLLLGGALFVAARFVQRNLPRRALQCGGAIAWVGAVVLWGLRG